MSRRTSLLAPLALLLIACARPVLNSRVDPSQSGPDRVWFNGASNIRSFTCNAKKVYVSTEAAPESFERTRADGVPAVRTAAVDVPVSSLDCGIGLQNSHLFDTLGGSAHPDITFALDTYAVERNQGEPKITIVGALRIAGVERSMTFHGIAFHDEHGKWVLRGNHAINVRDFRVVPPRRFLGLLRVRDEVTLHFELVVRPLIDPLGVLTSSLQ